MTIRTSCNTANVADNHINHVCYVANEDSGYYSYPYVATSASKNNKRRVPNSSMTRNMYPQNLQQSVFFIRKLQFKIVHCRFKRAIQDWVCSVDIAFANQEEEDRTTIGYCYMPLMPVVSFEYARIDIAQKNVFSSKNTFIKTVQPSALTTFFVDILARQMLANNIIFHMHTKETNQQPTFRQEIDLDQLFT